MQKLSDYINKIVVFLAGTSFLIMTILIFTQVIFRYIFGNSLSWSEELSRFLFIWATILGISVGVKRNFLLSITFVKDKFPSGLRNMLDIFIDIGILIFAFFLIVYGWELTQKVQFQLSPAMRISMSYVYVVVPISGIVIIIHLLSNWYDTIIKRVR